MDLTLNCDLGEHEEPELTAEVIQTLGSIGMANIACGGHAGNESIIANCLRLCAHSGVRAGAHPGWPKEGGRGKIDISTQELSDMLTEQIGRFSTLCTEHAVNFHHVKLHGSLYHATENNTALRSTYLDFIQTLSPTPSLLSLAGGKVEMEARNRGLTVWPEFFADRNYTPDGKLLPRSQAGALLSNPTAVLDRIKRWKANGCIDTTSGSLEIKAHTICVHSDTPDALSMIRSIIQYLR